MAIPDEGRVLHRHELAAWGQAMRDSGRTVAFTNGCFDLIHSGHLASLNQASAAADALVVALNDDSSVRQLKGAGRPVLAAEERAALIASLRQVSAVTIFGEPTPLEVINALKPDVLIKGEEYAKSDIVGAVEVESWGGKVVRVPMVPGKSTTEIIAAIKALP